MLRRRLLLFCLLSALRPAAAARVDVSGSVFSTVGRAKGIDPLILYAVALAESAFHQQGLATVRPWQFALRTSSRAYYGETYEDAARELRRMLKSTDSVDIGLMQINWRWHGHRVRRPEDLLDVRTNVSVAADILKERLAASRNNWAQALAQYHSFDDRRGPWYASFVLAIYQQISNNASKDSNTPLFLTW